MRVLEGLIGDPEVTGEFTWHGYTPLPVLRKRWAEDRLIGPEGGILIVCQGDNRLGLVSWRKHDHTPGAFNWEIGIVMLPEARGKGYGTEAQRLIARYLFAHTPVHRVWAATETGNIPEQKSLEKAGFIREGIQRGTGWRDGAWRDGVVYSLLRTDPW
jgi:RimJ/RimL family protein N-acetyltransferase